MTIESKRVRIGRLLLAAFAVYLGWYFLASYVDHRQSVKIQEKTLTAHDDLFAIDGKCDGNKIVVGKLGLILLSSDGGKSWQQRPSGTTQALLAVSFADRAHGFVVGSGGTVLATDDGGFTWRAQKSGIQDQLLGVYAVSPTQVFAVGAFGTLLSTSNGGRNWNKHEMKWDVLIKRIVDETGLVEPNLNAVYFNAPESGWIVGEFGLILHTKDGGQTWVSQRYASDLPQLYAIKFIDDRHGITMGQAGSLIQTTDGGQLWSTVEYEMRRGFYQVAIEGDLGVIVGDRVVLVSRDGGSKWQPMDTARTDHWLGGIVLKNNEAIVVGGAGTIHSLALEKVIKSETESKAP